MFFLWHSSLLVVGWITNESRFKPLIGIEQPYSIEILAFTSYNTHQIIIIKLQTDRNEYPQGSCWFAIFQPGTEIKLTGGIKSINFSILYPPTLPVSLLYYRRKSTSFSTEGNLFGNHMALDVISGESSLMNTSNEVRLSERNIIFPALGGRYKYEWESA